MKKILLILLFALSFPNLFAQKNSFLVYGLLSGNSLSNRDSSGNKAANSMFDFSPGFGYQFSDNLTAGAGFDFQYKSYQYTSFSNSFNNSGSGYNVSPHLFLRYTGTLSEYFFAFVHLEATYLSSKFGTHNFDGNPQTSSLPVTDYNGFSLQLTPGVGLDIINGWALTMAAGVLQYRYAKNNTLTSSSLNYGLNNYLFFGFTKNILSHKGIFSSPKYKGMGFH